MTKDRIKTGIKALDDDWGGFPVGRAVLVTGDAGSGKTIFGMQFANSACSQGLKTTYISTEESIDELREQGHSFDWDLDRWEGKGLLTFLDLSTARITEINMALEIRVDVQKGRFDSILEVIPKGTQVVVVDSLGSHTANLTTKEFKERFDLFVHKLKAMGLTALIIIDSATSAAYNDLALFSAYGALKLLKRENPYTGQRERVIDIVKMRNTKVPLQLLVFKMGRNGIVVLTQEPVK